MTLVAFDFDGTLSDSEMTVLLGERCGVAEEMAAITERAMNDEIGYAESLRARASLLEGLPEAEAEVAYDAVELRRDAPALLRALSDAGVVTAILTGGFERGVETALSDVGVTVDHVVANRLPVVSTREVDAADGPAERVLAGEVEGPLIEGTKDAALSELADREGVDLRKTIAIGDGANDLPMLREAGLAIGFDPKPAVESHCDVVVTEMAAVRDRLLAEGVLDRQP